MSPNPQQQWFKFNLPLFDEWVPKLSAEAGILLCVIVRKMTAWDKTEDTISVSQLMAASGMKKRRVQRAIKDLLESGAPVKKTGRGKDGATYSLDLSGCEASDVTQPAVTKSSCDASDATQPADEPQLGVTSPVTQRCDAIDATSPVTRCVASALTPTTDVTNCYRESLKDSLPIESGQDAAVLVGTPTCKDTVGEDGRVVKTDPEEVDPASVSLMGSPTSGVVVVGSNPQEIDKTMAHPIPSQLFKNPKTGRTWF